MESCVYFLKNPENGNIKIGHSTAFKDRLIELKTKRKADLKVLAIIYGDKNTENELHKRFKAYKINGEREWYRPSKELLNFIKECKNLLHEDEVNKLSNLRYKKRTDVITIQITKESYDYLEKFKICKR